MGKSISFASTVVGVITLASVSEVRADSPTAAPETEWGFGASVRRSHVSRGIQKLFVGDSPGSATQDGASIEFTRRTEQVEIVFAVGYDPLNGRDGYYLEKNEDPLLPGSVDYVEFDHLQWLTVELTAVGRLNIHKILALRYGAGLGLGIVRGEMRQTDALCTSDDLQRDCMIDPDATDVDKPIDLWPVLPVVNVLAGVELRPFRALSIHADVGFHTVPYVGAGATLYLW